MQNICNWRGISGEFYCYSIHPIGTEFMDVPGNYIFAKTQEDSPGWWTPVYIGQTSNLNKRFDDHHKEDSILREGATHIHVHVASFIEQARRVEEKDLIDSYDPPCNG